MLSQDLALRRVQGREEFVFDRSGGPSQFCGNRSSGWSKGDESAPAIRWIVLTLQEVALLERFQYRPHVARVDQRCVGEGGQSKGARGMQGKKYRVMMRGETSLCEKLEPGTRREHAELGEKKPRGRLEGNFGRHDPMIVAFNHEE